MPSSPSPAAPRPPLSADRPQERHQPFVHDLAGVFHAPVQAWSLPCGTVTGAGAQGVYIGDTRVVSALRCTAEQADLSPLGVQVRSAREVEFRDVVSLDDGVVDPLLVLHRTRTATAEGIREELRLVSDDDRPRRLRLRLGLVTDGASMSAVKDPQLLPAHDARPTPAGDGTSLSWAVGTEGGAARLQLGARAEGLAADGPAVTWGVDLGAPPARRGRLLVAARADGPRGSLRGRRGHLGRRPGAGHRADRRSRAPRGPASAAALPLGPRRAASAGPRRSRTVLLGRGRALVLHPVRP